nr:hypothetical protein [Streptomyces roseus]
MRGQLFVHGQVDQGQLGRSVEDFLHQGLPAVVLVEPHVDAGVARGVRRDQLGGQVEGQGGGGDEGEGDPSAPAVRGADVVDGVDRVEHGTGQPDHPGAFGGEVHPSAPAGEELDAEVALHGLDGPGEGGLGNEDRGGRAGDGTAVRDGDEVTKLRECGGHDRTVTARG